MSKAYTYEILTELLSSREKAYKTRHNKLIIIFILPIILLFILGYAGLEQLIPAMIFLAASLVFLIYILILTIYIVFTSTRFEKKHDISCPHCGASIYKNPQIVLFLAGGKNKIWNISCAECGNLLVEGN